MPTPPKFVVGSRRFPAIYPRRHEETKRLCASRVRRTAGRRTPEARKAEVRQRGKARKFDARLSMCVCVRATALYRAGSAKVLSPPFHSTSVHHAVCTGRLRGLDGVFVPSVFTSFRRTSSSHCWLTGRPVLASTFSPTPARGNEVATRRFQGGSEGVVGNVRARSRSLRPSPPLILPARCVRGEIDTRSHVETAEVSRNWIVGRTGTGERGRR